MPILSQMSFGGGQQVSPEERQLRNERRRVKSYIRQYERDPGTWNNTMLQQLESLALQYQIPFKRQAPEATFLENLGAGSVGALDAALFDLIPDKAYSSEATRKAANYGKIAGGVGALVGGVLAAPLTGGASAAAGAGNLARAAAALRTGGGAVAKGLSYTPVGAAAKSAAKMGKEALTPIGASRGWGWATKAADKASTKASADLLAQAKNTIEAGGDLGKVVKGKSLGKEATDELKGLIKDKFGTGKVAKSFQNQLNMSKVPTDLKGLNSSQLYKLADKFHAGRLINTKSINEVAKKAKVKLNKTQNKLIKDYLDSKGHKKFSDAAIDDIIKMAEELTTSPVAKLGIGDINKTQALGALGMGAAALSPFGGLRPSREDLQKQEDPYDPFNM